MVQLLNRNLIKTYRIDYFYLFIRKLFAQDHHTHTVVHLMQASEAMM